MKKVYITTQFPAWVQSKLQAHLTDFEVLRLSSDLLLEHKSEDVVGLLVRSQTRVDKNLIDHFQDLQIVGTATSGFDHLDLKILKQKNVSAFYTPDANIESTADLTLLHILTLLRNNFSYQCQRKDFKWKNDMHLGHESHGISLGILGMGRIGRAVAKRAQAFGFKIFFHDPYIENYSDINPSFENLGKLELFTHCDVISLHVPLTEETRSAIDKHTLDHFGEDKILINCARGELINTVDLLRALDKGTIRFAGLDSFEGEPLALDSDLRNHPRVFWSPHIGAYTHQAFEKSCAEASNSLIYFLKNQEKVINPLPPEAAWFKDRF